MIFRFGKYKGYTLADVELNDPSYVRWARNNAPNLIPKKATKIVASEEEEVYIKAYTNLPFIDPSDAF